MITIEGKEDRKMKEMKMKKKVRSKPKRVSCLTVISTCLRMMTIRKRRKLRRRIIIMNWLLQVKKSCNKMCRVKSNIVIII
jgi:hypothetical protein